MTDFNVSIEYVLQNEGGYVNNPSDPGNATNYGITMATLCAWRKAPVTEQDVQELTVDEAKQIYQAGWWEPLNLGQLPQDIATALLDTAVNLGQATAIAMAQKCVSVTSDGIMGPMTINALRSTDNFGFLYNFINSVQEYYLSLGNTVFLKGWLARSRRMILLLEPVQTPQS
jgi:lysozyme family protein